MRKNFGDLCSIAKISTTTGRTGQLRLTFLNQATSKKE